MSGHIDKLFINAMRTHDKVVRSRLLPYRYNLEIVFM